MADTMRSLATLETLLADNTTGDISPQDLRDALLATVQPGHGEIYISSSVATTFSDLVTWVQVAGNYSISSPASNWAMTQNGRLYYTGAADRVLHIAMSISMTSAGNNQVTEFGVGLDGTILTPSIVQRKIGTGADVGSTAAHAFTTISNGSYIAGMCRNTTSTATVTATTLNLFVMDMAM